MNAQRIPSIELSAADETTKRNFEKLTARIGRVPNMPRAMAQSPAALEGWMSLLEAFVYNGSEQHQVHILSPTIRNNSSLEGLIPLFSAVSLRK